MTATIQALADHWSLSRRVTRAFNKCRRLMLAGSPEAAKAAALDAIYTIATGPEMTRMTKKPKAPKETP